MSGDQKKPTGRDVGPAETRAIGTPSSKGAIDKFLTAARTIAPQAGGGRLAFALDATMSRQPTWDAACRLQGEMFDAVGANGKLAVQLIYFRGFGECRASRWVSDTSSLRDLMTRIDCRGGQTQIGKVLAHVRDETQKKPVSAAVYIGDAMEEDVDRLCTIAASWGCAACRSSCFRKGATGARNRRSRRSRGSRAAPMRASTTGPPSNCRCCCRPWRAMHRAG
jgi:hypothetical protein